MKILIYCLAAVLFPQYPAAAGGPPGGRVTGLLADTFTPGTLYAWSDGAGIFRSIDSGANWSPLNNGLDKTVQAFAVSRNAPATLFAGTAHGLFKSVNGGASWFVPSRDLAAYVVSSVAPDPSNPAVIYAGTGSSGPSA